MTSVTDQAPQPSKAQVQLEYALGKRRVDLEDLSEKEFYDFLKSLLEEIDLREIRGFKALREFFVFRDSSPSIHTVDSISDLSVSLSVSFEAVGFKDDKHVDLDMHLLKVCRGLINPVYTYKRHESGEETQDYKKAMTWGRTGYLYKGTGKDLVLRRPRNHGFAEDNMAIASFAFEKVPLEHKHIIRELKIEHLPFAHFREYFGSSFGRIAVELIWELRSALSRTADELSLQATRFKSKTDKFDMIGNTISYSTKK